ncbi:CPBP family intramembrane glutamic endopeptidase [Streptococcus penaeicida]|uniref:CPBP family intramembrane glutamic endopeptidase n=1 Tax=Streptococcus penaeicida TaxID=1765960 RepID=UPI001FEA03B2|nr:CPBP family intramembrane glutamic endopeptidase [Streptococcus penaeicida]
MLLIFFYISMVAFDSFSYDIIPIIYPQYKPGSEILSQFSMSTPWITISVKLVWCLLLFFVFYLFKARFFTEKIQNKHLKVLAFALFLSLGLQVLSILLTSIGINETANQATLNQSILLMSWPKLITMFVIIAPLTEELVMRGLIMRYLLPKYPYLGILLSAYLFSSLHYTTKIIDTLLYLTSGFIFAFAYYKTNRLQIPIIIHASINFLVLIWIIYFR